jgi:hypothetical protein
MSFSPSWFAQATSTSKENKGGKKKKKNQVGAGGSHATDACLGRPEKKKRSCLVT